MAIATSQKLIEINPKYAPAYMNLSISYRNKGNNAMADQYKAKYDEVVASNMAFNRAGKADNTASSKQAPNAADTGRR